MVSMENKKVDSTAALKVYPQAVLMAAMMVGEWAVLMAAWKVGLKVVTATRKVDMKAALMVVEWVV